jgi:hypothetical protein
MREVEAWRDFAVSESSSNEVGAVSALVAEMREAIIELAGDRALFDTRDRWLERAARAAGISRRMAKTFFYNEKCNPSSEVVDAVRAARDNLRTKAGRNARRKIEVEAIDILALEERLARVEAALRLSDSDAYRALVGEDGNPPD